jgi:hypothetical protein
MKIQYTATPSLMPILVVDKVWHSNGVLLYTKRNEILQDGWMLKHGWIDLLANVQLNLLFANNERIKTKVSNIRNFFLKNLDPSRKRRYHIDDWAHDIGIVCCETPSRDC